VTGPRQIGQAAPSSRRASTAHRQRWPHGLIAIVGRRSKHTTQIGSAPIDVSCTRTHLLHNGPSAAPAKLKSWASPTRIHTTRNENAATT
jgi:hypothetical protein